MRHLRDVIRLKSAGMSTRGIARRTGLADWISGHVGAFEAIGGVPALLVPDNTKVAVIKACLYDPQINRSYADMVAYCGTAILPARPRRPRDKAKVEQAVRPHGRALAARAAAPSDLPQPRRGQCGDRRVADQAQRGAADPAARRDPPQAAGGDRPAGTQGLAGEPLRVRRVADLGAASTITSRSRRITTASRIALSVPSRGALHCPHRRDIPQG
jgi:transposase